MVSSSSNVCLGIRPLSANPFERSYFCLALSRSAAAFFTAAVWVGSWTSASTAVAPSLAMACSSDAVCWSAASLHSVGRISHCLRGPPEFPGLHGRDDHGDGRFLICGSAALCITRVPDGTGRKRQQHQKNSPDNQNSLTTFRSFHLDH